MGSLQGSSSSVSFREYSEPRPAWLEGWMAAGEAGTATPTAAPPRPLPRPNQRCPAVQRPRPKCKSPSSYLADERPASPPQPRPHSADAPAHGPQRRPRPGSQAAVVRVQGEAGGPPQQLRGRGLPGLRARVSAGRGGGSAREQPQQPQEGQPGRHREGEAAGGSHRPTDPTEASKTLRPEPPAPLLGAGQWASVGGACALICLREARGAR